MLELRPSIVAINPAPTDLAANEVGFMGSLEIRGFAHGVTARNFWSHRLASFSPMNRALTRNLQERDG